MSTTSHLAPDFDPRMAFLGADVSPVASSGNCDLDTWVAGHAPSRKASDLAGAFKAQVGAPAKNIQAEPHARQCLLAALVEIAAGTDPKIASSQAAQKARPIDIPDVLSELYRRHAYSSTILMAAVSMAKHRTAFSASVFSWVKEVDAQGWIILQAHGDSMLPIGAAAIIGHYLDECMMGRPLENINVHPYVEQVRELITRGSNAA